MDEDLKKELMQFLKNQNEAYTLMKPILEQMLPLMPEMMKIFKEQFELLKKELD